MAYALRASISADWIPEGAGPASVPSAQTLQLSIGQQPAATFGAVQVVESTDGTLTAAQVNAAASTLGSLAASYFGTIQLGTLQGWSSGKN